MTENDILTYLRASVPSDISSNADAIARIALGKALIKIGRMPNVDWNRRQENITLTSGTSKYKVGVDILNTEDGWNIQEMWCTDTTGFEVEMKTLDDFNDYKRGNTGTGRPIMAAYYGESRTIEFYPTPDSAYELWVYFRKEVKSLSEVPDVYHDAIIDYAMLCIKALRNSDIAFKLASDSFKEIQDDALLIWRGNVAKLDINMGQQGGRKYHDSGNLRG
jgi:hypothetical protein